MFLVFHPHTHTHRHTHVLCAICHMDIRSQIMRRVCKQPNPEDETQFLLSACPTTSSNRWVPAQWEADKKKRKREREKREGASASDRYRIDSSNLVVWLVLPPAMHHLCYETQPKQINMQFWEGVPLSGREVSVGGQIEGNYKRPPMGNKRQQRSNI